MTDAMTPIYDALLDTLEFEVRFWIDPLSTLRLIAAEFPPVFSTPQFNPNPDFLFGMPLIRSPYAPRDRIMLMAEQRIGTRQFAATVFV